MNLLILIVTTILFSNLSFADVTLTLSVGKVYVKKGSSEKWEPAKINSTLLSTDTIKTGKNSKATIKLSDGSLYTIGENQTVKIIDIENRIKESSKKSLGELIKEKTKRLTTKKSYVQGEVTGVAGVRGADVDNQKKQSKATNLKWKE